MVKRNKQQKAKWNEYMKKYNLKPAVRLKNIERSKNYRLANLQKLRQYDIERYPARKEQVKLYKQQYRKDNKQKLFEDGKLYREKNKEILQKKKKEYYASPHGQVISFLAKQRRRLKQRKLNKSFTIKEWKEKKEITKGICPSCKKYVGIDKLTMDHIIPINKAREGFIYTINEVQPLCKSCNCSKQDRIIKDYFSEVFK